MTIHDDLLATIDRLEHDLGRLTYTDAAGGTFTLDRAVHEHMRALRQLIAQHARRYEQHIRTLPVVDGPAPDYAVVVDSDGTRHLIEPFANDPTYTDPKLRAFYHPVLPPTREALEAMPSLVHDADGNPTTVDELLRQREQPLVDEIARHKARYGAAWAEAVALLQEAPDTDSDPTPPHGIPRP